MADTLVRLVARSFRHRSARDCFFVVDRDELCPLVLETILIRFLSHRLVGIYHSLKVCLFLGYEIRHEVLDRAVDCAYTRLLLTSIPSRLRNN